MNRYQRIQKVLNILKPLILDLENESDKHAGPAGRETHFKLLVVSDVFEGQARIERQRYVNELLKEELQSGLHALTQRLLTPTEWEKFKLNENFISPDCGHKK